MKNIILIVTNTDDLHADLVIPKITIFGGKSFRLNLDEFPKNYIISVESDGDSNNETLLYIPTGQMIELEEVGATWIRKNADFSFFSDDLSIQEKKFAIGESDHILKSLLYGLNCYWLSHPTALRGAGWKIEQTKRAARMGFKIPRTLVTNDANKVRNFYANHPEGIVTKAMSSAYLAADEVDWQDIEVSGMPTTLITDEMMKNINGVKEFPTYFQAYIDKEFELRVTIIGEDVFAARLNSQDSTLTMIDSRNMSAEIEYSPFSLPKEIKTRCIQFVKSYGLEYGAIDLIVSRSGEYVFLENNPGGQFLFIEQLVPELKIMDCLAKKLVDEALCQH
jgi:glutathione synthase/RimK-type ligase-like ATP-grasp enzyme